MLIRKIFYCPIKSISFIELDTIEISEKKGIINDRVIAFTRGLTKESSKIFNNSKDRNLNFFLTLKNSPYLKKFNFFYDSKNNIISLFRNNNKLIEANIKNQEQIKRIEKYIENIDSKIKKPIYLIYNENFPFFDTTPDISISLININTIRDLELKINKNINYERFRGNILIDDLNPWEEFNLIDKKLKINNLKFKVESMIPRCSATNINPKNYSLDINLPNTLIKYYGHKNFGIYLSPLSSGFINKNDKISIL